MDFEALLVDLLKMNKSVGVMFLRLVRDLHVLQLCLRVSYHYMVEKKDLLSIWKENLQGCLSHKQGTGCMCEYSLFI